MRGPPKRKPARSVTIATGPNLRPAEAQDQIPSTSPGFGAIDLAAAVIATRWRLSPQLARAVVILADLGGRAA